MLIPNSKHNTVDKKRKRFRHPSSKAQGLQPDLKVKMRGDKDKKASVFCFLLGTEGTW